MKTKIAIIGAGSAGLSALEHVRKQTDNYVIIDRGPLGTTCARTGCMPSKVLINVAREFNVRKQFEKKGIYGADTVGNDIPAILGHVRTLRDFFTGMMVKNTRELAGKHLIEGDAQIITPHIIEVDGQHIEAEHIIIATGASPFVPKPWHVFGNRILTSQTIFEQKDLPKRIAVIGLGAIGLEIGQALSRLGIEITGFNLDETIGGLTDTDVNASLTKIIQSDFNVHYGQAKIEESGNELVVSTQNTQVRVDAVLAAMGVVPNLQLLDSAKLGIKANAQGIPEFNSTTGQIANGPMYIAGDATGIKALLHEAQKEGSAAGATALSGKAKSTTPLVPLRIVFTDPEVMVVGASYNELEKADFVTGMMDYAKQARAIIEGRNEGLLKLYASPDNGLLLGAEAVIPDASDIGHLLAFAIQQQATVFDLLQMPFYHPTLLEGLDTALKDVARKCTASANT
ncbi:MAG TPA: dihydrolipoyl dehydrogenase [Treponemataceae bacterium]|nr:dihydrolipoyl dehydrogenase [Treponemataceae bacterium]